jgi:UDP-GlcNAc:undecaprenyl-phosphate GlcNAc-1-phosphate transferase
MRTYLSLFLLGALFTMLATPLIRAMAHRLKAYGRPRAGEQERRIARLGGLGVLLGGLAAWGLLLLVHNDVHARFAANAFALFSFFVPSSLVLVLGICDDIRGLPARPKLAVEVSAAILAWWLGVRIVAVPVLGGAIHSPWLSLFLTVLWIVAVTNSINLIDGLDGLAAGVMFFVTLTVFAVSLIQGQQLVCILAITLAGALVGFLAFNFAPATIYLGDTGSLFLGFLLACLAVHTSQKSSTLVALVVPYIAFGLPLFDTTLTVIRRFLSGRPIFDPDHGHIHHRLLERKLKPRTVALILYALAVVFSLGSLLIVRSTGNLIALVAVLGGVLAWFLSRQLQYEELAEVNAHFLRALRCQRRVLANQILIRKSSREIAGMARVEDCWTLMTKTLAALDFDGISCQLVDGYNGSAPALPSWKREGRNGNSESWSVAIPLLAGYRSLGVIELRRTLAKDRLLFEFSSLLDTLLLAFQEQLAHQFEQSNVTAEYDLQVEGVAQRSLVANGARKA